MKLFFMLILAAIIGLPAAVWSQLRLTGHVVDAEYRQPLAYVNIGIKQKNIGSVTLRDGSFLLDIPKENMNDTITFSLVGYEEYNLALRGSISGKPYSIRLAKKNILLDEVTVVGQKPEERRFGIKRHSLVVHFSDGIFNKDDIFEIGQLIKLGDKQVKLTALNLYMLDTRDDSATFRINFYRYRDGRPAERVVEKNITQRHAIKKGWLQFDLTGDDIRLSGDVIATLEFLPEHKEDLKPISYEVKLGGTSRSFYRRSSLGAWNTPPHHYCLYVTALVNKGTPEAPDEEIASTPAFVLPSQAVGDSFSVFVLLPADYGRHANKRYPVLYHLDGNAYFDQVKNAVDIYSKSNQEPVTPIVVGIGYENAYLMDSLRVRDYTYPKALPADSFATSGGADRFYTFITEELIPYIDSSYHTDTASRTIMGHSFGGYFVLYALLRDDNPEDHQPPAFNGYVSASPSIGYRDGYIVNQLTKQLKPVSHAGREQRKLYLTMGERELEGTTVSLFTKLSGLFKEQKPVLFKIRVYRDTDHMGTAVPSFEDAIPLIYK